MRWHRYDPFSIFMLRLVLIVMTVISIFNAPTCGKHIKENYERLDQEAARERETKN